MSRGEDRIMTDNSDVLPAFDRKYVEQALQIEALNHNADVPISVMTFCCRNCLAEIDRLEAENKELIEQYRICKEHFDFVIKEKDELEATMFIKLGR